MDKRTELSMVWYRHFLEWALFARVGQRHGSFNRDFPDLAIAEKKLHGFKTWLPGLWCHGKLWLWSIWMAFVGLSICVPTWSWEESSWDLAHSLALLAWAGGKIRSTRCAQAWQIPASIHRDISRLLSTLYGRFSYYSDKKGLCAACLFSGLKCWAPEPPPF